MPIIILEEEEEEGEEGGEGRSAAPAACRNANVYGSNLRGLRAARAHIDRLIAAQADCGS